MKTIKNRRIIFVAALMIFGFSNQLHGQSPGIECGCDTYDNYLPPASKGIYIQQGTTLQEATSKNGKYRVETVDAQYPNIHITIYYGNKSILSILSRATGWGFSPDEDRFVIHGFDQHNKHWYTLYNLDPNPSIEGEQAVDLEVYPGSADVSSARLRFSPHGKYLLYGAIGNMGNLVLYIHNAVTGDEVYHPTALIVGSPSGKSVAGWGFSSDARDRTFVHAMLSNATTYTLTVKNLEKNEDEYVLKAPGNSGRANFRFSPCGDYFLWTFNNIVGNPVCKFYKTSEKNSNPIDGDGVNMIKAFTKADGHYIKKSSGDVWIFDNTSDGPCDDDDPPDWSGASLTASNITGTRVTLNWDAATDASSTIYYKVLHNNTVMKEIENLTQVEITGLTPDTVYTFVVKAGDETGNWSSGLSTDVTTASDNRPTWPPGTLTASDIQGVKMTLTWPEANDNDPELTYKIYLNNSIKTEVFGITTYTVTDLIPLTDYNFKIVAGDEANQWTLDTLELDQSTAYDPPPTWPSGAEIMTDSITETSLAFHWPEAEDVWGVTKYEIYRNNELIQTLKSHIKNILDEDLKGGEVYEYKIRAGDEADGNWSNFLTKELKTMSPFVELPLITGSGTQSLPDIDHELVVWQDTRNGNADIYSYDLNKEDESQLTTEIEWQGKPVISGKSIVWADARNGNSDIYILYPTIAGRVLKCICDDPGEQTIPQIDGTKIVWADFRSGDWDIYMYDLETMQEKAICTASGKQTSPSISGNIIVWEDYRHGNPDIYGYKIYQDEEFEVCKHPDDQTHPVVDVHNNYRIFWQDNRNGNWDIYMWTPFLNSTWTQKVSLGYTGNQTNPHIADDQLVYQEDKDGSLDIYAYKFYSTFYGDVEAICTADSNQVNPRTSNGRIVWEDRRNDGGDIYIYDRPPGTDLSLELTEVTDPVGVGKILKYIITATNDGPDTEDFPQVICELPVEAEFSDTNLTQGTLARNGLTLTWDLGILPNDSSATLEINLKTFTIAKLQFKAQISGNGFDPDPSNNKINETTFVKLVVGETIGEGNGPSMFVEPSGRAHIFYAENDSTVYSYKNPTGLWHSTYMDSIYDIQSSDILLDENGYVHICYSDQNWEAYPDGWLHHMTNQDAGIWKNRVIALSDSGFSSISMDINDRGNLHMLYQQAPGGAFHSPHKYMNYKSGHWSHPVVFIEGGYDHIDMVLDKDGFAHASYFWINQGVIFRESEDTIINSWSAPELIEPDWGGGQMEGMILDIGLDSQNNPHIVYPGNTDNDHKENIKYATKKDGIWHYEQVDEGDFGSGANAIVVEPSGKVHISYLHFPSGEVRYATNIAGPWIKQTIDIGLGGGWLNGLDMGLDNFGNIHILYENGIIKYAKRPPINFFTVEPDTLDFGTIKVDSSVTRYLTLYNPGSKKITIDSARVINTNSIMVQDKEIILYPDTKDSILVEFSPESSMLVKSYLRIFFNGASQMFMDVPLRASTPIPRLTVSPDPVNYAYVDLGSKETKTVTLTNTGTDTLIISEINVKHEFYGHIIPSDFDLEGHDCTVLAPGENCSVQVSLSPTKPGSHSSYLNIYSNDLESNYKKITLSGYTSSVQINAEFNQLDFGYQELNQTATRKMKLYNIGQLDLTISNVTLSGSDPGSFDFRNTCTTILPGDSCEIEIDFTPESASNFIADLNIFSNSTYFNPLKVSLTGNANWKELVVSDETVDFGQTSITDEASMIVISFTNNGSNELLISELSIIGPYRFEFNHSGFSGTINAGESVNDTIWFSPLFTGEKHATLQIVSNDSDEPIMNVSLKGSVYEGVQTFMVSISANPEAGIVPLTVDFLANVTGGIPPYNYLWDFGDQTTGTEQNPSHLFNASGDFNVFLSVTDANGEIVKDSVTITVLEAQKIFSGQILNMDGVTEVTNGTIELYLSGNPVPLGEILISGLNSYTFSDLLEEEYTIKFIPDQDIYPDGLPTYLGNVLSLAEATFVTAIPNLTDQNIHMITKPAAGSGDGIITGNLQEDEGTMKTKVTKANSVLTGEALQGIFVYLRNENTDELKSYDLTNDVGYFEFLGLENGSYTFITDYLGIPMDSENPVLTLNEENDSINILSTVYSGKISTTVLATGINDLQFHDELRIFPVPANDYINLQFMGTIFTGNFTLKITSLSGRVVRESNLKLHDSSQEFTIRIDDLPGGIYIITLSGNKTIYKARFIKVE